MKTEYEAMLEADKEALRREVKKLTEENRQLKELVNLQMKNRPIVNRDVDHRPLHSCL